MTKTDLKNKIAKKKNILFVLPDLEAGGAQKVLITLLNDLDKNTYNRNFLSVSDGGELEDLIQAEVATYKLKRQPSPLIFPFLLPLYFKISEIKPDIIVSTMTHMNFAVLFLSPLFPRTLFVVREAITPSFFLKKYESYSFLLKFAYKTLYTRARIVLSPTNTVFREFRELIGLNHRNFVKLKNPINEQEIKKLVNLKPRSGVNSNRIHFIACGRLEKQKGYERLIRNLSEATFSFDWTLDILGTGSQYDQLEKQIKNSSLEKNIFLRGLVRPPYNMIANADCLLLCSHHEGLPNVVLEALACGTPVIATQESGGIQEIVDDCGKENVRVMKDMNAFISEMGNVKKKKNINCICSLLNKSYQSRSVQADFEKLLRTMK